MEKCFGRATEKHNGSSLQEQPEANLRISEKFHQTTKALLDRFCLIRYTL